VKTLLFEDALTFFVVTLGIGVLAATAKLVIQMIKGS